MSQFVDYAVRTIDVFWFAFIGFNMVLAVFGLYLV